MPRGFTTNQTQVIDQKLVNFALSMIQESGVRKTTIESLTRAANISTGAFYNFYTSKEALFFKVYELLEDRIKTQFLEKLTTISLSSNEIKEVILATFESENMRNLLTLIGKQDLNYILMNIDPSVVQKHQQADQIFINRLIDNMSERGFKVTSNVDLILAYLQALFSLCYDKDQFTPYSTRIIDSFVTGMLDDLAENTTRKAV